MQLISRLLFLSLFVGSVQAAPLPPVDPNETDATVDFASRRVSAGVFMSNGFDSWGETNTGKNIRTGAGFFVDDEGGPHSVPNNIHNGYRYAAHDPTFSFSGPGSLRLTINDVASANHSGDWRVGAGSTNAHCIGASPGTNTTCEDWAQTIKQKNTGGPHLLTWSYRFKMSPAAAAFDWSNLPDPGERHKLHIIWWGSDSSCTQLQNVLQMGDSDGGLNNYSNCSNNLTRYGVLGSQCSDCANTFDYPHFGPPISTSSTNSSYWSQHSPTGPPDGHKYASPYTSEASYDKFLAAYDKQNPRWVWFYGEIEIGIRAQENPTCTSINSPDCSSMKVWYAGEDGVVRQFIDYYWPWSINQASAKLDTIMLTAYRTGRDSTGTLNDGSMFFSYDELLLSTSPQPVPAGATLGGDTLAPNPPTNLRFTP